MNPAELRATLSLASVFALRLFGMFVILPVFALWAEGRPGWTLPVPSRPPSSREAAPPACRCAILGCGWVMMWV